MPPRRSGMHKKYRYSFEFVVQTDRRTESILECTLKDLSNDNWHAYQIWKLVGSLGTDENNIAISYLSRYTRGEA